MKTDIYFEERWLINHGIALKGFEIGPGLGMELQTIPGDKWQFQIWRKGSATPILFAQSFEPFPNDGEIRTLIFAIDPSAEMASGSIISQGVTVELGSAAWPQESSDALTFARFFIDNRDSSTGGEQAMTIMDNFNIVPGPSTPTTSYTWNLTGLGDWNQGSSWTPGGGPPKTDRHTAVFGGSITGASTVTADAPVTVNRIEFNSAETYAIAGLGGINLVANTAPSDPSINVIQGSHQFQAAVNLLGNTTVDVASDSSLSFNNALNLMGQTLAKTGAGTLAINNQLTTGGGEVIGLEGTISGSGTIGGDVVNQGGTISPGNSSAGPNQVPEPTAAGVESLWLGQKRIETPHLAIRYSPTKESTFWRG